MMYVCSMMMILRRSTLKSNDCLARKILETLGSIAVLDKRRVTSGRVVFEECISFTCLSFEYGNIAEGKVLYPATNSLNASVGSNKL